MPYRSEQLPEFVSLVTETVEKDDLQRKDWKRQTDAVQLTCILSQMVAEDDEMVFLVNGRIEKSLIRDAINSGNPKKFFNQRCHDKGLKCRRVIILDTKSGNNMDEKANKASNLHFHGVFMLEDGQDKMWLLKKLRAVFGAAYTLGPKQFHINQQDPSRYFSFAGRRGTGIKGKLAYMLDHAGTTHTVLKLNKNGKRSRKAPKERRSCNKTSQGLAAGIPTNFVKAITICDNVSKREGKKAFDAWMQADDQPEVAVADRSAVSEAKHGQTQDVVDYDLPYAPDAGIVAARMTRGPLFQQRASLTSIAAVTARTP